MPSKRSPERPAPSAPSHRRQVVLWSVLACSALALAAYRVTAHLLRDPHPEDNAAALSESGQTATSDTSAAPRNGRDEPDAPLPQTHEELIQEMTRIAERAMEQFPEQPIACDLEGRVHFLLGNSAQAEQAWQKCLNLAPRRPDALHGLAKLAIKRGDDAAAEPQLREALAIDPNYPQAATDLADLLMRTQRLQEATEVLQNYLQQVPTAIDSLLKLAQAQQQLGDFEAAAKSFGNVVQARPNSYEARFGLGTVLMRLGRREEAREHMEQARQLQADKRKTPSEMSAEEFDLNMSRANYASAAVYASKLYELEGDPLEAARLCRRATQVDPKNLPARLTLISLYEQMRRLPEALEVCQDTLAVDPENPDLLWRLGVLRAQTGEFGEAEAALRKVIQLAPKNAQGYAGLAEVYLNAKRQPDEALRLAREAVRLAPTALHYALLGRVQVQAGDWTGAQASLGEAVKREPNNQVYRQLHQQLGAMQPRS